MKVNYIKTDMLPQKKPTSSLSWRQYLGKMGEQYVSNLLNQEGWKVIERNWRAGRYAEIDIIAQDPEKALVFIEVKTRIKISGQSGFEHSGYDKLDRRKIQKLLGCARLYMAQYMLYHKQHKSSCRFDAFVLYYPREFMYKSVNAQNIMSEIKPEVEHIKNFCHDTF